ADLLVRGAVALARQARVPPVVVALTVVALGTSLPELVVALQAAFTGYPGILLGNVVGSNIANVLLVMGVPALVYRITCSQETVRRDAFVMLGASFLLFAICLTGEITRLAGVVLLLGLVAYSAYNARAAGHLEMDRTARVEWVLGLPRKARTSILFIVIGLVCLPLGADLLIEAAVELAITFGVSNAIVGLTLVAVGTSLPELATVGVAAARGHMDVAVGNVLGSNTLNILAIMGLAAVASPRPITVPQSFLTFHLPIMLLATLVLAGHACRRGGIPRSTAVVLVAAYGVYVVLLYAGW
ncbi:MAG: calcium/sodium antiporter, partial [Gemmatimonadota bacterium]